MPKHIAFVCLHGSAKSLMAAEYLNRRAIDRGLALEASSAGREPDESVPSHVTEGMRGKGIDVAGRKPAPRRATISRAPIASSRSAAISATT